MRLLELLIPSAKSRASIAKTEDTSQISLKRIKEPLTSAFFLSNLSEKQTIKLNCGQAISRFFHWFRF